MKGVLMVGSMRVLRRIRRSARGWMKELRCEQGRVKRCADRSVRTPFAAGMLVMAATVGAVGAFGYYDPSTFDRQQSYAYLDQVEEVVGGETFGRVAFDHAFHLAQRMGPIDRYNVPDEVFVDHLLLAGEVRGRFYRGNSLTDEEFKRYLLPLRIRSESTARPAWRRVLKERLEPRIADCGTVGEAAGVLIDWMAGTVTCGGDLPAYRLSKRGDTDPVAVLELGRGGETDLAVFGVAVFRSVGIAARVVWTPTLDGMIGGKVWVEYRKEDGSWDCWVPLLAAGEGQATQLRDLLRGRAAVVLTHPESPFEITGDYLDTVELAFGPSCEGWERAVMCQGTLGIDPVYDAERGNPLPSGVLTIGRTPLLVALTRQDERYLLLPVHPGEEARRVTVTIVDGEPRAETINHEDTEQ